MYESSKNINLCDVCVLTAAQVVTTLATFAICYGIGELLNRAYKWTKNRVK